MNKKILVINAGSSSIKFKLFNATNYDVISSGICERIYESGYFKIKYLLNNTEQSKEENISFPDHEIAINHVLKVFKKFNIINDLNEIIGVGHRVVQIGDLYDDSQIVTDKIISEIKHFIRLAPLHNEPELKVINIFRKLLPSIPSIVAFDTSFHCTIPPINYVYAIDKTIAKKYEIRRYGAHGTSYKFINIKMKKILNNASPNLIVCHIGNGASVCAIKNGKSFNTSMGLTPLEGLIMGTRCGDVDPSIAIYLSRVGMSFQEIDDLLNKKSGLLGLTGTNDLRDIVIKADKGDQENIFAINLYTKKIAEYIIRYTNELENKVDAVVFTAGVGENQSYILEEIISKIKLFNLSVDKKNNRMSYDSFKKVSDNNSKFPIYVVRTDEEMMIAKDVVALSKK